LSASIKRRFLELLDKDEEFRLVVAAKLGLSEEYEKLDAMQHTIEKLVEEVKALREGQEKLWQNVDKLWLEVKALREGQEKLWQNVDKLWLEVKALREGQEKLFIEQQKLTREVHDVSVTLQRLTLTEEEEAAEVIAYRVRTKLGVDLVFSRKFVDSSEIDLYASQGDLWVIGEATTRLGVRLVDEIDEKVDLVRRLRPNLVKPNLIKVAYTIVALDEAIEEAKRKGVWVLTWKDELSPLVVHTENARL
jgi:regulator of replication initiation timing